MTTQALQRTFCVWVINHLCKGVFFKSSMDSLLPALRFLGGLYNFCNFIIYFFNVSHDAGENTGPF